MGRSKQQAPKRRKIDDDDSGDASGSPASTNAATTSKEQQEAIATLLTSSPDAVDAAAADATRIGVQVWPKIDSLIVGPPVRHAATSSSTQEDAVENQANDKLPSCFHGLGKCTLDTNDFKSFQELHTTIQRKAKQWTSWSGSPSDPRKRVFGFLPPSFLGLTPNEVEFIKGKLDVTMPQQHAVPALPSSGTTNKQSITFDHLNQDPDEERQRNKRAMVDLDENDSLFDKVVGEDGNANGNNETNLKRAINNLLEKLRPYAPRHIQPYLSLKCLVAAQPNLHCGRHLLPAHFDHPLKDGFGICIVTVAIKGNARVFLEESTTSTGSLSSSTTNKEEVKEGAYGVISVKEGEAYMLSGPVRNQCTHGVLADIDCGDRESLNLRFGIHGVKFPDDNGAFDANKTEKTERDVQNNEPMEVVHPDEVLQHW